MDNGIAGSMNVFIFLKDVFYVIEFIKCDLSANLSTREGYGKINKILSTAEPDIQSVMFISHVMDNYIVYIPFPIYLIY
jgi:ribosomal 30S subunit maturation factor RimM